MVAIKVGLLLFYSGYSAYLNV